MSSTKKTLLPKKLSSSSNSRGWFPEDSWIDDVDKSVSMLFYTMESNIVFDLLLVAPGTWFGMPVSALGIMSYFLVWYAHLAHVLPETDDHHPILDENVKWVLHQLGLQTKDSLQFMMLASVFIVAWGVAFYICLVKGTLVKAYMSNRHLTIPSVIVPIAISRYLSPQGYKAGTFYVVVWFFAQTITFTIKIYAARLRPAVARKTAQRVHAVRRTFPEVRSMLAQGEAVFESFPSGDTVGSAIFSAQLYAMGAPSWTIVISFITAFARMYFHAHHFLDVVAGLIIGWSITLGMYHLVGLEYFDIAHTMAWFGFFLYVFMQLTKRKPKLPEEYRVVGRKGF